MTLAGLLIFAAAFLMVTASPEPGAAALVAQVMSRGISGISAFIAGFVLGDLIWFSTAASGLAVLANTFATLFIAIKYAGAAYLLVLSWKLWTSPVEAVQLGTGAPREGGWRLFLAGLVLTLSDPKVIVFSLALLLTVVPLDRLSLVGFS